MDIPLHKSCPILNAHPCGLIAVEKAPGIMSHPNKAVDRRMALLDAPYDYETETFSVKGKKWVLINRLDAPTSGVILLSDNPATAAKVKEAFFRHAVSKTYLAIVKGAPPRKQDSWRDCLKIVRQRGSLRTVVSLGRANALCDVKVLERSSGLPDRAMISLNPTTGKTHQLRVQCASRHIPIVGDGTYGDYSFNREFKRHKGINRLFLHSWKTSVHVVVSGKQINFSAESQIPEAFAIALD